MWNDATNQYEFYAVDYDGSLARCYDTGDGIQWIGTQVNTALWEFVEYRNADGTPNDYYELRNVLYGGYIAPLQAGDQILSDGPIGINLNGRRFGDSYTPIVAWDDSRYAFSGLKVEDGRVVACPLSEAQDFYFAIVNPVDPDDTLTIVDTVDSSGFGIEMRMVDYDNGNIGSLDSPRDAVQNPFFGGDNNRTGLLSTNLDDDYPTATDATGNAGRSLAELYAGATPVNHLFLQSVYNESGYFEYDSISNFAHLNDDGTFTVYGQIGSISDYNTATGSHGQFMPYNDLTPGQYCAFTNQTSVTAQPLADLDPRKGEKLYNIGSRREVDYGFGMEMSAEFTQTADGLDAWGHDIIFEFSGDDDFWFYVDGEQAYAHVFMLKPGQSAEVNMPDEVLEYYVVECAVKPDVYDRVQANGSALEGTATGNAGRRDYRTPAASLESRASVDYVNHVRDGAMRTLSVTKKLYDADGETLLHYPDNPALFSFRLYLGSENEDEADLPLANMYDYCVRDAAGQYCRWDAEGQRFVSIGKNNYGALTEAEREAATFTTSLYGSIARIPADHTVEVRNLIVGTRYKVEERDAEIPRGYTRRLGDGYARIDTVPEQAGQTPVADTIDVDESPHIEVRNQKGWGLTIEKKWTDSGFVERHEPIYFGVYVDGALLEGSVRRLDSTETGVYYYFFEELLPGKRFWDYSVRGVVVSPAEGFSVDDEGRGSGYEKVTPVDEGGTMTVGGLTYTASYEIGEMTDRNENVRADTVTNSSPGIVLTKTDWNGVPLAGAVFTLKTGDGEDVAAASYTSRADGLDPLHAKRKDEAAGDREDCRRNGFPAGGRRLRAVPSGGLRR